MPQSWSKELISSTISRGGECDQTGDRPGSVVVEPAQAESQLTGQDTKAKMIELKQMFDEGLIPGASWPRRSRLLKNM